MEQEKLYLGIDIGSTTFKAVLMTEKGKVRHTLYQRTKPVDSGRVRCTGACAHCGACNFGQLQQTVDAFLHDSGVNSLKDVACTVVTGSQIVEDTRDFIPYDFKVSEVSAHVAGARHYIPNCEAILDVGGQDSKAMVFNRDMQMWNYKMSGICAAGTGAFLDSVAAKLNIPVEEMSNRVNYDSDLEFSSVCAVLGATSINKFKNRFPIGEIIGGACRAQARTIMSSVGELFQGYHGKILFQGGVAYNRAVSYYLHEITGNEIVIPEFHAVMGALGCACLARTFAANKGKLNKEINEPVPVYHLNSISERTRVTARDFFGKSESAPRVWRNLFFPSEILNAYGAKTLTLETYAALFARNGKRVKKAFDHAACKGFSGETCSFLRVLEGIELPEADFAFSTSQPCQQGERVFRDLVRNAGKDDRFISLQTPPNEDGNAVEHLAEDLERSVHVMEQKIGRKMDPARLAEACANANEAREISLKINDIRAKNRPLIRGSQSVYFANIFAQMWGRKDMIRIQTDFLHELEDLAAKPSKVGFNDTHRLLWLHLPPFYQSGLLDYIEVECRAPIVFEEVNYVGWEPLNPDDPYRSLAKKILTTGFMDPALRVKAIIEEARHFHLDGCILYNHGFGRCSMSDASFVKHAREELTKAKIPLLVLDGDCMDQTVDPCSTYTKVAAYTEALNEKKYGNIFGPMDH